MADSVIEQRAETSMARSRAGPFASMRVPALTGAQRSLLVCATALGAIFAVYLPVLARHYFFNDDFVPLADITSRTTPQYIKDLFLMHDLTPNWRFLTGLYYLGAYRAFHLTAWPYFFVAIMVHLATAGLIFHLVRRALGSDWTAFLAAAFFGLAAGPVPTVGQVTAVNNVFAACFVMLAIVLLYEGCERFARPGLWLAAPAIAFAAAIASNESAMVLAPVLGLVALWKLPQPDGWWQEPRAWVRPAITVLPFALLGLVALAGFEACHCTEASKSGVSSFGSHMYGSYWILLGRLLYPIGLEPPGHPNDAHLAAGIAVAVAGAFFLVRGPALARIAAVFLFLALLPNSMITFALGERYTYVASVPFAILAAVFFHELARYTSRLSPVLPYAAGVVAIGVLGVYSWQTVSQNHTWQDREGQWHRLVSALQETYPGVPPGSVVYVRGGPLTDPLAQCAVMPALAHVLWGNDRILFTNRPEDLQSVVIRPGSSVFVGDFVADRIAPAEVPLATAADLQRTDVKILPTVDPSAKGNLCPPADAVPALR